MINKETLAKVKFVNNSGQKESGSEKQPKERSNFTNILEIKNESP